MDYITLQYTHMYKQVRKSLTLHFLLQIMGLLNVLAGALIFYKLLMLLTNSESPVVVVLSGSMEPGVHRGDIMVLVNHDGKFDVGEIVVYKIPGRDIPIVHRIVKAYDEATAPTAIGSYSSRKKNMMADLNADLNADLSADLIGSRNKLQDEPGAVVRKQLIMTKGDNNFLDDLQLYDGRQFLTRDLIVGRAMAIIPRAGWLTIALNDYPLFKYFVLGALTFVALFVSE